MAALRLLVHGARWRASSKATARLICAHCRATAAARCVARNQGLGEVVLSWPSEREKQVGLSAGIVELAVDETIDDFIKRADAAMYQAKTGGRDRICLG